MRITRYVTIVTYSYICRVHAQCKSGWDDDGDDDDVDGGADFLLFCLFHVSSADEFLLQTGVVRQSVKYLYWHTYGYDYI